MANTVNMEEKLALAKALNLKHQVSNLEYKVGMFDLKFKPITLSDINKRLRNRRFSPDILANILVFLMFTFVLTSSYFLKIPIFATCLGLTSTFGFWVFTAIKINSIKSCWVDDFKYEIPYGGMLALKEASNVGIEHHRIFFPTDEMEKQDYLDLLVSDPIIVGINKSGKMVEIYAWNENDVYES